MPKRRVMMPIRVPVPLWAFGWLLLGLSTPALSQLGEDRDGRSRDGAPGSKPPDYYEEVIYEDYDDPDGSSQWPIVIPRPSSARPVAETYQGCMHEEDILNSTFHFVNFTSDTEVVLEAETIPEACFNLCLKKDPFSYFISLNLGLDGDNDACGCHSKTEVDLNNLMGDDSSCDTDETLARIYCGPENVGCINSSPRSLRPSLLALIVCAFVASFIVAR